jgi:transcriptional regulator with PAS, ATPase and Fis domain
MTFLMKREKLCRHLDKIFDTFKEGVCVTDDDGTILYLNNKYEQLANLKNTEILGKSVEDICQKGTFDFVVNPKVIKFKKPVTGVQSVSTGPNLFLDGYPIFDKQGKVTLVISFIRDMKSVQALKNRLSSQEKQLAACKLLQSTGKIEYPKMLKTRGLSPAFKRLRRIAVTDAAVLLLGETGVGKDVFAKELHALSARSKGKFVKADCTCIPENLMESEFFGYESGAFSGANRKGKKGFFEMANSGTLFLDEIGELPLHQQTKLLRVLQDRQIVRLGSSLPKKVDVRIIAATNKDLDKEVEEGRFRSDLFYRLKVAVINIPPLRERCEDIKPLVDAFLSFYIQKYQRDIALDPQVTEALCSYGWKGNVRELENTIISLVVTCENDIAELNDLPHRISFKYKEGFRTLDLSTVILEDRSLPEIMGDVEKEVVMHALNRFGSIGGAAKQLKVDRTTIYRKLKKNSV